MHLATAVFWPERALPTWIVVFGMAFGVVLVSGVRILFLGDESRPTGA
jgi:hypothetical protein